MNHNQAVEKIRGMPVSAMPELHLLNAKHNQPHECVAEDYLTLLAGHEGKERENEKINRLLAQAGYKPKATVTEIRYLQPRNRDDNFQRSTDVSLLAYLMLDNFGLQASDNQVRESLVDIINE